MLIDLYSELKLNLGILTIAEYFRVGSYANDFISLALNCKYGTLFSYDLEDISWLTHWGRVTHICVSKLTSIGSDNSLSPGRRQAIIWTNTGILFIGPLGTSFSEILIEILKFSFKKMRLKVSSANWRPFCLGLSVLKRLWSIRT